MPTTRWKCLHCNGSWVDAIPVCHQGRTLVREDSVGRFRLAGVLGRGGLGEVHRAVDDASGREVALKLCHGTVRRTLPSAPPAARHPHIAAVLEVGQVENGHPYVVSELAPGVTLRQLLDGAPASAAVAAEIGRQLAEALAYLHDQDLLHEDLKPQNVVVERRADGHPHARLIDLASGALSAALREGTGAPVGTPLYMAPEVIRGERPTPAADVYALGCVLYEMVVGRPPFTGDQVARVVESGNPQVGTPPALPRGAAGEAHPMADLVTRCLAGSPRERPSATMVAAQLAEIALHTGEAVLPDPRGPVSGVPPAPRVRAVDEGQALPILDGDFAAPSVPSGASTASVAFDRALPEEDAIAARLGITMVFGNDPARPAALQMAATLRAAVRTARALDALVSGASVIEPADAQTFLQGLALARDEFALWLEACRRGR